MARAWNKAIAEVGGTATTVTADILKKEFGKTMSAIADSLFHDADQATKDRLMAQCCVYEHDELEANTEPLFFPDVVETIQALAEKHRLFIISNCQSGYIELFMKKANIERYIEDWECYGDTGKGKGDNIIMLMERNQLTEAVYVGDTQGDYEATLKAKVPFIFAKYGFGNPKGYDRAIDGFKELLSL